MRRREKEKKVSESQVGGGGLSRTRESKGDRFFLTRRVKVILTREGTCGGAVTTTSSARASIEAESGMEVRPSTNQQRGPRAVSGPTRPVQPRS